MKELFTLYIIEDSYLQTFSHSLHQYDGTLIPCQSAFISRSDRSEISKDVHMEGSGGRGTIRSRH